MPSNLSFSDKKILVFDLDGTLIDLDVDWMSLKQILTDRYTNLYAGPSCEFESISGCLNYIVDRDDEPELGNFFDIIRSHELKGVPTSIPIKEAVYFIKNLNEFNISNDVKIAVFSLNTRACIKASLELAGLVDYIDFCVGREDVRKWKPNPEGLLTIKDHYMVKNEEMIFFGDMDKDIQAGLNAGIDAYYINEIIHLVKEKKNG